jgi:methyl-accepting chemotaxis protein
MSIQEFGRPRRRLSLSVRVSLGLVLAAIVPLLITVAFSEWQTRPELTAQANTAMESDAKTRVQLIDAYFRERQLDTQTLAQVTSVQQFLATPPPPTTPLPVYQDLTLHATYALAAGIFRDKLYTTWELFDTKGEPRLYYPLNNRPQKHGQSFAPPEDLQMVRAGKTFISAVYYSPATQKASVDLYSPIYAPQAQSQSGLPVQGASSQQQPVYIGFIRATLNLDYVWNIVDGDRGNNGAGSYAFILDENGVRIADTMAGQRFQAVAPLTPAMQQLVSQEARYGSTATVPVLSDPTFAQQLGNGADLTTFQAQPAGQNEPFQVVQKSSTVLPWHYFVLSPISTVTAVANQQLFIMGLVAFTMLVLAALIGLIAGRRITYPILTSVEHLLRNSSALSELATSQRDAASEQMWVVDSSQVGLQSVQYYTEATRIAAHRLSEVGLELARTWGQADAYTARLALERIVAAARYIEEAAAYQNTSNQKLATALKVATQVSEQLATGATSATDAATQLEQVVAQLRSVVGK